MQWAKPASGWTMRFFLFLEFRHVIAELKKNAIELYLDTQKMGKIYFNNAKMSEVKKPVCR